MNAFQQSWANLYPHLSEEDYCQVISLPLSIFLSIVFNHIILYATLSWTIQVFCSTNSCLPLWTELQSLFCLSHSENHVIQTQGRTVTDNQALRICSHSKSWDRRKGRASRCFWGLAPLSRSPCPISDTYSQNSLQLNSPVPPLKTQMLLEDLLGLIWKLRCFHLFWKSWVSTILILGSKSSCSKSGKHLHIK